MFSLVLVASVHIVPMPIAWIEWLSPATQERFGESVGDPASLQMLSLAPAESRLVLTRLWLAATTVVLVGLLFRSESSVFLLLALLAANGALLALFGIFQRVGWNPTFFWENPPGLSGFGPFFNRNNAAGYLAGCLPAAVVLAISQHIGLTRSVRSVDSAHYAGRVAVLASVVAIFVGILISFCRGSYVALIVSLIVLAIPLIRFPSTRGFIATLMVFVVACIGVLIWVDSDEAVKIRFAEITEEDAQGLILHWVDDVPFAADYWKTGCGLGAYRFANRAYQSFSGDKWFAYCENQYLEILISTGIVGLGLVLLFQFSVVRDSIRLLAGSSPHIRVVGILGLLVITINSVTAFFDFALFHSSNLLLLAAQLGIVLQATAAHDRSTQRDQRSMMGIIVLLIALLTGVFSVYESVGHARSSLAMGGNVYHNSRADQPPPSLDALDTEILVLQDAIGSCPDHPTANRLLARLYLERFRLQILEQINDESARLVRADLWQATRPEVVASRFDILRQQSPKSFQAALDSPELRDVELALRYADRSIESCSAQPRVYLQKARIARLLQDTSLVNEHLNQCLRLAPVHPNLHMAAGYLALTMNDLDNAAKWIIKSIGLGAIIDEKLIVAINSIWRPDEFVRSIPPGGSEIAMRLFRRKGLSPEFHESLGRFVTDAWNETAASDYLDSDARKLGCLAGEVYSSRGDRQAALECYRLALSNGDFPELVASRLRFAKLLEKTKSPVEAVRQAEICCRQSKHPVYARYRNQLLGRHIRLKEK
jgi:tetratricopeptide (TPR) repeat protein/low affinity Fe/Cu permease